MTEQQTNQQPSQQQSRFEPTPQVQAELTTLNVRYRDMQDTMSRLISMLVAENVELKTENVTLKNQYQHYKHKTMPKRTLKSSHKMLKHHIFFSLTLTLLQL